MLRLMCPSTPGVLAAVVNSAQVLFFFSLRLGGDNILHTPCYNFLPDIRAWQFTLHMYVAPIVARLLMDLSNANGITMRAVGAG